MVIITVVKETIENISFLFLCLGEVWAQRGEVIAGNHIINT